jgi:thiol-disulfide isomerase/thioredoxin
MAFAVFLMGAHSSKATVLRLEKKPHDTSSQATGLPTPMLKPTPKLQDQASEPGLLDLTFTDDTGKIRSLNEYKGSLIVLNFWATWCAPCVKEMPDLSKLQEDYADRKLVVITLSQDNDVQKVQEFFQRLGIKNLPAYLDSDMKSFQALDLRGLPVTILIDESAKEVIRLNGFVDWNAAETRIMIESNLPKPAAPSI